MTAVKIFTIRQSDGAPTRPKETVAEHPARYPMLSAQLLEHVDGTRIDIRAWPDPESAQATSDAPADGRTT